jgi:nickel/cobalt transporter (NicO) family protein
LIWFHWLYLQLIDAQRGIYLAYADRIGAFAKTGDWWLLTGYLPMGIVFGAVHALTPGHSKAVLATYLAGSTSSLPHALLVSIVLSLTHVTMSVLIVLLSLPLVSLALGSVGRAPMLEDIGRLLLGVIGIWMLWQAFRGSDHHNVKRRAILTPLLG